MRFCNENRCMCWECPLGECHEQCNNNEIASCQWKKVFVHDSIFHRYGLFAGEYIKKGEFIIEYLGIEYKKNKLHKHRGYSMEMDKHYIDAFEEGSLARYINHVPGANARFVKKIVAGSQRCGVFAINNIKENEEITCSYKSNGQYQVI